MTDTAAAAEVDNTSNNITLNAHDDTVEVCIATSSGFNGNTYVFELNRTKSSLVASNKSLNQDGILVTFPNNNHQGYPHNAICFLPEQQILIASPYLDKSCVNIFDVRRKKQLFVCSQAERITCLTTTPDGIYCFGGGEKGVVYVWQVNTGKLLKIFDAHTTGAVTAISCTPDGAFLITGGKDSNVHVWNLADVLDVRYESERSVEPTYTFQAHSLAITSISCSLGSHTKIVTASLDGSCVVWDLSSGNELCTVKFYSGIHCAVLSLDEHTLYAGCSNGRVYETKLYPFAPQFESSMHQADESGLNQTPSVTVSRGVGNIKSLSVEDHDQQQGENGTIKIPRASHHACFVFKGHTNAITDLSLSSDGMTIVSASKDGTAKLWDTQSKQLLYTFKKHTGATAQEFTNVKLVKLSKQKFSTLHESETSKALGKSKKIAYNLMLAVEPFKKFVSRSEQTAATTTTTTTNEAKGEQTTTTSITGGIALKQIPGVIQIAQTSDNWRDIYHSVDYEDELRSFEEPILTLATDRVLDLKQWNFSTKTVSKKKLVGTKRKSEDDLEMIMLSDGNDKEEEEEEEEPEEEEPAPTPKKQKTSPKKNSEDDLMEEEEDAKEKKPKKKAEKVAPATPSPKKTETKQKSPAPATTPSPKKTETKKPATSPKQQPTPPATPSPSKAPQVIQTNVMKKLAKRKRV